MGVFQHNPANPVLPQAAKLGAHIITRPGTIQSRLSRISELQNGDEKSNASCVQLVLRARLSELHEQSQGHLL
ncbi:MAG: hypothetical protein IPN06_16410 [Burkholderiales bacterium]|nr:hypothetical protein [Burkholderiales bacterium]